MPGRGLWTYERGELWALTLASLPSASAPLADVVFTEITVADAPSLATVMGLADAGEARARFAAGSRCFTAQVAGQIACYGWVSRGAERIGELERTLRMRPDEAYIWDCATLPTFRRRGLYTALLRQIETTLGAEGARRVWIGASARNEPSLRAFASAGFHPAVTVTFARLLGWRRFTARGMAGAPTDLVAAAQAALASGAEHAAASWEIA